MQTIYQVPPEYIKVFPSDIFNNFVYTSFPASEVNFATWAAKAAKCSSNKIIIGGFNPYLNLNRVSIYLDGEAFIDGYWIKIVPPSNYIIELNPANPMLPDGYVYICLSLDIVGDQFQGAVLSITDESTIVNEDYSICIGRFAFAGGTCNNMEWSVIGSHNAIGEYTGNDSRMRNFFLGFKPKIVMIGGSNTSGERWVSAISPIELGRGISICYDTTQSGATYSDYRKIRVPNNPHFCPSINSFGFTVDYDSNYNPMNPGLNRITWLYKYRVFE